MFCVTPEGKRVARELFERQQAAQKGFRPYIEAGHAADSRGTLSAVPAAATGPLRATMCRPVSMGSGWTTRAR